ncbi:MAG: MFS transporter [Alphaproteobacteria bacterium]|nr:MFS transporter [Alphaproteobacteria bacterium]MCK5658273.1 MFS transporter [Alphaproteobacteria bacterium]
MRIQRNLLLIDIYTVCRNMHFWAPILLLHYRDQVGIGFKELMIGEAVFSATIVLLDVPTGWISDIWRRKHTQALGVLFAILGYSCLLFAESFSMVLLAQVLIGIFVSLCSGTDTAILYDSLLSVGREKEYLKREGRRVALLLYSVAGVSVIGGLLYPINHRLPLAMTVVAMTVALIIVCLQDEPERQKKATERHPIADIIATIKYALHGHVEVGFLIMFSAALFCSTKILSWAQQPYYLALNMPESYYGVFIAIGYLLGGISSHWSHLLNGHISTYRVLTILWAFAVLVCLGASIGPGWHGVALLITGGAFIYGIAAPRINEAINNHVGSSRRAAILSTQNLMISLLYIPLSMVMGSVSKHWGIQAMLLGLALWLCLAGACIGMLARRKNRRARAG